MKSVDKDPFGKPYKLVMKKLRGPQATALMEPSMVRRIADGLFPTFQPLNPIHEQDTSETMVPLFSQNEVDLAINRVKRRNSAPGPDGITTRILSAIHKIDPVLLPKAFNICLISGVFPTLWKKARIVLIEKGDKPEGEPSSYRPLCLLNDVGQILEHL